MGAKDIKYKRIFFWCALTIAVLAVIITVISVNSTPLKPCVSEAGNLRPMAIIDPGHGGIDGGAVSADGVAEAGLNLIIGQKTYDFMRFLGVYAIMTRSDDTSIEFDPDKSVRDNKNADIRARFQLAQSNPGFDFLSIHMNKFEEPGYYGAQVFYSGNNQLSVMLAQCVKETFVSYVDPSIKRVSKQSHESIYLMKNIKSPAVTIECGFLSNPDEAKKLCANDYQHYIAIAITKGYLDYIKER